MCGEVVVDAGYDRCSLLQAFGSWQEGVQRCLQWQYCEWTAFHIGEDAKLPRRFLASLPPPYRTCLRTAHESAIVGNVLYSESNRVVTAFGCRCVCVMGSIARAMGRRVHSLSTGTLSLPRYDVDPSCNASPIKVHGFLYPAPH